MKILVIGYYGKLNAGDDLLQQAIANLFLQHKMAFSSWFPGQKAMDAADVIVVGGGSIWPGNPFFESADEICADTRTPIIVLGISAKNESSKILKKTEVLIECARLFHVRDQMTRQYFGPTRKLDVGPDLFWWAPFGPKVCTDARTQDGILLNLREWPDERWNPQSVLRAVKGIGRPVSGWALHWGAPEGAGRSHNDATFLTALGLPPRHNSFSWGEVLSTRYVVAMRYHAIQLAIRLERPVVGFDYHRKMKAFFEEHEMPELCVPLDDPGALVRAIERIESDFERYRSRVVDLKHSLLGDGAKLKSKLDAVLADIEVTKPTVTSGWFVGRFFQRVFRPFRH